MAIAGVDGRALWPLLFIILWLSACASKPTLDKPLPRADIHLHYKWNQSEVTSLADAVATLEQENIVLAGVIGTPPVLAQHLQRHAPDRIFSWYGVYRQPGDWSRWMFDETLVERARVAITRDGYAGIGELHLIGGFAPRWDTPVIAGLLHLSAEFQIPLLLHVEFSRPDYLISLCQQEPRARLLLAHAGATLKAEAVARALAACPNLWWELSARDPERYVDASIVDAAGVLRPEWRVVIEAHAKRLLLGSDPVWPVEQLNPWDEPDTGWMRIGRFWAAHERWLTQLPADMAADIRLHNALRFMGRALNPK